MKTKTVRPSPRPVSPRIRRVPPIEAGCAALLLVSLSIGCFGEDFEYGNPSALTSTPPQPAPSSTPTASAPPSGASEAPSSPSAEATGPQSGDALPAPNLPGSATPPGSLLADAGVGSAPSCASSCGLDASTDCSSTACPGEGTGDEGSSCGGSDCTPQTNTCSESDALCAALRRQLVHRYSFGGTGTTARDSVSGADGSIIETELDDTGRLKLDGGGAHVQLPSGIISALESATFETWVLWDGGDTNQRLFNFGKLPASGTAPTNYFSLTPSGSNGTPQLALRTGPGGSRSFGTDSHFATGRTQHVAVVVDADAGQLSLYLDGELVGSEATPHKLDGLQDEANFLGRALYVDYPPFRGELDEFRIYAAALSLEQVRRSGQLGPDARLTR